MSDDIYNLVRKDAENLVSVSGINMLASLQGRAIEEQRQIDGIERKQAIDYIKTLADGMIGTVKKNAHLTDEQKTSLCKYIDNKLNEYKVMVISNAILINLLVERQKELQVRASELTKDDLATMRQAFKDIYAEKIAGINPRQEIKAMVMEQVDAGLNKAFPTPEELKSDKSLWEIIVEKVRDFFSSKKADVHEASSQNVAKLREQAKAAYHNDKSTIQGEEETGRESEAPHR